MLSSPCRAPLLKALAKPCSPQGRWCGWSPCSACSTSARLCCAPCTSWRSGRCTLQTLPPTTSPGIWSSSTSRGWQRWSSPTSWRGRRRSCGSCPSTWRRRRRRLKLCSMPCFPSTWPTSWKRGRELRQVNEQDAFGMGDLCNWRWWQRDWGAGTAPLPLPWSSFSAWWYPCGGWWSQTPSFTDYKN